MEKKYKISEMSWTEFIERSKETDLVIIPTGAVEIYGPHLPMGSDGLVASHVAEEIAKKYGGVVAPFMPLSDSSALLDFPGTFTITSELFTQWIEELMDNLYKYSYKDFVFITGHAASVDLINSVARKYQMEKNIRYFQIDWWRFAATHGDGIFEEKTYMAHGHASECGTSVLLHLYPELVDMDKATCERPDESLYKYMDFQRYIPISEKSTNAIVGNALLGTKLKGEMIVNKCLDRIGQFLEEEWNINEKQV